MKGMGEYEPFEEALGNLNIDEINELYLTGKLHEFYDKFENTKVVPDMKDYDKDREG